MSAWLAGRFQPRDTDAPVLGGTVWCAVAPALPRCMFISCCGGGSFPPTHRVCPVAAVAALTVVTLGVAYLSFTSWMDSRTEADDRRRISGMGGIRWATASPRGQVPAALLLCWRPGCSAALRRAAQLQLQAQLASLHSCWWCSCPKVSATAHTVKTSRTPARPAPPSPCCSSGSGNGAAPKKAPKKKEAAVKEPEEFKGFGSKK